MFVYLPWTEDSTVKGLNSLVDSNSAIGIAVATLVGRLSFVAARTGVTLWKLRRAMAPAPPPPPGSPVLLHVVVIPAYKEPWDVLSRTLDSLVLQTVPAERRCVVLALESRDPTARETYKRVHGTYGASFAAVWGSLHGLVDGEIVGKSSNENFAVRWLYARLAATGSSPGSSGTGGGSPQAGPYWDVDDGGPARRDPNTVMVTICDADSDFVPRYLEHVEAAHFRQLDGRRCLYDGALNTWANLADEPNPVIRWLEV